MNFVSNELIDLSLHYIPSTEENLKEIKFPLNLIIRPFLYEIPIINYNLLKIPRCKNCSTFKTTFE